MLLLILIKLLKSLLKISDCCTTNVLLSFIFSCLFHFFCEIHVFDNHFVKWMPDVFSLDSSNCRIGFQIVKGVSNSKWFNFLSCIKVFCNSPFIFINLCFNGFFIFISVSIFNSWNYYFFFCEFCTLSILLVYPGFKLSHFLI